MTENKTNGEVWVLGATGRSGRAVAERLAAMGVAPVLVGRDAERLKRIGVEGRVVVAGSIEETAAEIGRQRPAVVINTVGPFTETAPLIARAAMPGGHYLDLANDLVAIPALLALHNEAVAACSTLVTGAGFGVLATEAVVVELCAGRPTPSRVRVDAVASVAIEAGELGSSLAATIVEVTATGGRRYAGGRLVKSRLGGDVQHLALPDGQRATTVGAPSGELHAARTASGAPDVTATTALIPAAPLIRALLPLATALMSIRAVRAFATRRLAAVHTEAVPPPRDHSWGHAVVQWPDGTTREGWLRTGDAMDFTAAVLAEAATRLARGEGEPGAHTPARALGHEIATAAGGTFI